MGRAPAGRASHRGPKPNPKIETSKTPLYPFFKKGSHYFRLYCLIQTVNAGKNLLNIHKGDKNFIKFLYEFKYH